jgi:Fic family protein
MANKKYKYDLVSKCILDEAIKRKENLIKHAAYHCHREDELADSLHIDAIKHSASIEIDRAAEICSAKKIKEWIKEDAENLIEAGRWARYNYEGKLNEKFIKSIANTVDPFTNRNGNYRTETVTVRGASWSPPGPEKINDEMSNFIANNETLENSIDKAVHAHFHLARIHPFRDGNGRTARLVQNTILYFAKYPPIIIREEDKSMYGVLLDSAIDSYKKSGEEGDITKEKNEFYNFLAKKIIQSFDEISEKIKKSNSHK